MSESRELTTNECMDIFKKYDKSLYEYYLNNMWFFGCNAKNYAKYLKENATINIVNDCNYMLRN